MLATQRNFCLIERKTGQFIAIFGIWNRKRTESVRRFNRRFAHTLKLATEPNRTAVRFGSVRFEPYFRFGSLFSLLRTIKLYPILVRSRIRSSKLTSRFKYKKQSRHTSPRKRKFQTVKYP